MDNQSAFDRIKSLPCWDGPVVITPLNGGLTNENYTVADQRGKFVVRLGEDIPEHHVLRFNELAASRAAHAAGLSPAVRYVEHGIMVIDFIDARTYTPEDVRNPANLPRIVHLLRRCHTTMPEHLRGATLMFDVFHVIRDYAATLNDANSQHMSMVPGFLKIAESLNATITPRKLVYGHNDLVPPNILDDGARLWLIDWDYAGFSTPLFDLGGLASNNGLSREQEIWMLENYFETPINDQLLHEFSAIKTASLLRETMWSMVSEATSKLDLDFTEYTAKNLQRFEDTYHEHQKS